MLALFPNELFLIACLVGGAAYHRRRVHNQHQRRIEKAAQHTESGHLCAAAEVLRGPAYTESSSLPVQVMVANLRLRSGLLGQAVWTLTHLGESSDLLSRPVRYDLNHSLAYALAIGGALDLAESHCSITARLRGPISPLGCLLLCKRGRFSELAELASRPPLVPKTDATIDPSFAWHGERVIALLTAFAYAQNQNQATSCPGLIGELLEAARPTYTGEYDYLQADWPDLRNFVDKKIAQLQVKRSYRAAGTIPRAEVRSLGIGA